MAFSSFGLTLKGTKRVETDLAPRGLGSGFRGEFAADEGIDRNSGEKSDSTKATSSIETLCSMVF
jgi:hypothetical protein